MGTDSLVIAPAGTLSKELTALVERTRETLHDAVPANTRRAYEGDLRRFAAWCTNAGLPAIPAAPSTLALYLRALADGGASVATIERALAAISSSHVQSGHPSPWGNSVVADMRAALRRELGTRPTKKKAADDDVLRRLLAVVSDDLLGLRDRAMLTVGWAGAFRRSELVALDVEDITDAPKGLIILIRSSKTDQERRGEEIPLFFSNQEAHCPVRTLRTWLRTASIVDGAVFRGLGRRSVLGSRLTPATVAERVQHWAKLAKLDPRDFAGHSLRSGFVTTAARRGKDLDSIMRTTRHKSERVARGYIEHETIHERGAGEGLL